MSNAERPVHGEPPPSAPAGQWDLTLHRGAGGGPWQTELNGPSGPRHFESMATLIRWLVQLERQSPRGIR